MPPNWGEKTVNLNDTESHENNFVNWLTKIFTFYPSMSIYLYVISRVCLQSVFYLISVSHGALLGKWIIFPVRVQKQGTVIS